MFTAFVLFVPVPYYMIVAGGIVTTAWKAYLSVQGLFIALPKFTVEGFWLLLIVWTHTFLFAGILYVAAHVLTWLLFLVLSRRSAYITVFVLIAVLIWASTYEIYRMPGHNSSPPGNIGRLYKGLFT